ncbi:adenosylcobinamide-phosphate synthase CbiB [Kaistia geumhonensis]|uniref:Cobalamin biosynthesis protein CobD n=1 Tax=Kaistia geumhonensis TaxID=410839 RepID=A0ABU0M143_9HYPH|nr:adenosylcobinamide-phosphate synthase CbiB [Kaistia geumhonensis]MCX5480105.1 adenosylcobinamide-phosphate synthase CbiB [Kaistia geumhonensis]MDQ0514666.1 adenosylcobinamide-phosphate synthase [Kaistia geumhonensis]
MLQRTASGPAGCLTVTPFHLEARLWLLLAAIAIDAIAGDPDFIWRRIPHPVAWFGALIGWADRKLNAVPPSGSDRLRRVLGMMTIIVLTTLAFAAGLLIERFLASIEWGLLLLPLIASIFLASRSLHDHVRAVRDAFDEGGLVAARRSVAMIVGRDPDSLDEAGVCRAAIESTAENFSDGFVAPALWFALLGLPGLFAYKMINTADSMIGHLSERHRAFGWASARLDDLVNLPASRLAGALIVMAAPFVGTSIRDSFVVMLDDARKHRSPNAGWPEAAMAGALGLALAGPRRYAGHMVEDPFLNAGGRRDAAPGDIAKALKVLKVATALTGVLVVITALWLQSS